MKAGKSWQAKLQAKLAAIVLELSKKYDIKVREEMRRYAGWALLEGQRRVVLCPKVRGAVSFAIFAHEVGHHVLGHDLDKTTPADEEAAWGFAKALFGEYELQWTWSVSGYVRAALAGALEHQGPATSAKLKAIKHLENQGL